MKAVYASLALAAGASAASLTARDSCCFGLTAAGGVSGVVGQLADGQNRIAQTAGLANTVGQYCINNGAITDGNGRGCILTSPTTQFQCDVGATPTGNFSVTAGGNLAHLGNTTFYACPTGDNGGYNVYTVPAANQNKCVAITLSTGGKCLPAISSFVSTSSRSSSASSTAPTVSTTVVSTTVTISAPAVTVTVPASTCPAASTVRVTPAASTITVSTPAGTVTVPASTCPAASTVRVTPAASTVTVSAPAGTVTVPASTCPAASTITRTVTVSPSVVSPVATTTASVSSSVISSVVSSRSSSAFSVVSSVASSKASSVVATSTSASACQTSLTGAYQTPHAIIPVNSAAPDKSYGTQYYAWIGNGNSTIFNFDIPYSYAGKQCSIIFLWPTQSQLTTSSYTTSGSGGLNFESLSSAAPLTATYNSAPKGAAMIGSIPSASPGHSYLISTGACQAGTTQSIEVSSTGSLALEYFEDWNPSPIGLFLTSC